MTPSRDINKKLGYHQEYFASADKVDFYCTEEVDFGRVYLGQVAKRVITATSGIILESELQ